MLAELCKKSKTVVVGEIGLDYYWDKEAHDIQKRWFIEQLKMAQEAELPVNIHSRDAAKDTLDIMRQEHAGRPAGSFIAFPPQQRWRWSMYGWGIISVSEV